MNEKERRYFKATGLEIRQEGEGENKRRTLRGYAAVFNVESEIIADFREVIAPGAFTETLKKNPDVRATIEHEGGLTTIGRTKSGTLRLQEDEKGLRFEDDLPDTQAARDLEELVRRGDLDDASFAFNTVDADWDTKDGMPLRTLKVADLDDGDVSVVTYPAYKATTVSVRSQDKAKAQELRTAEDPQRKRRQGARKRKLQLAEAGL